VGAHEVTVGQFRRFVEETGHQTDAEKNGAGAFVASSDGYKRDAGASWRKPGFEQTDDHPVVCVSWDDAVAFCEWLSRKERKAYSLPTEAQWEHVCRTGSATRYPFGDDRRELSLYAWDGSNAGGKTHPVGSRAANAWGLYDTYGNVSE